MKHIFKNIIDETTLGVNSINTLENYEHSADEHRRIIHVGGEVPQAAMPITVRPGRTPQVSKLRLITATALP